MTREDQVEKMLNELEEEFAKANMPINDKLTLFAKVSNIIYKYTEQEFCGDAISRQAVLDALDKSKYSNEFCKEHYIDWSINLGMAHIVVNELKPVKPTEKTGHWIDKYIGCPYDECSECGHKYTKGYFKYNYCAMCGAKMQEVE